MDSTSTRRFRCRARGILLALAGVVLLGSSAYGRIPWYSSWVHRQEITISSNMTDGDLTSFPVLVQITNQNNAVFGKAESDGHDILFTDGTATNKIPHEIEYYSDTGTKELDAWIKLPLLSSNSGATVYMYYHKSSSTDQQQTTNVWSEGFGSVWHLSDTAGTNRDSTAYDNDGTPAGGATLNAEARIAGGDSFNGTDQYIDCGTSNALDFSLTEGGTVQLWCKPVSNAVTTVLINRGNTWNNGHNGWSIVWLSYGGGSYYRLYGYFNNTVDNLSGSTFSDNLYSAEVWHHLAFTWDPQEDGRIRTYWDGNLYADTLYKSNSINHATWGLRLGGRADGAQDYEGILDEVRLSQVKRSDAWIKASYNSQNSPGTYLFFASEEEVPRGTVVQID